MPVLVPIVAAAAAYAGSGMVVGAIGLAAGSLAATVAGVVAGAVIGAAVGAIGAAITDGDIGEGALWGAVGGAVAGGFAGYSGAFNSGASASSSAAVDQSSMHALNGQTATTTTTQSSSLLGNISEGSGMMGAAAIQSGGQALSGYAEGEAMEEAAKKQAEAADKARKEEFEQRMKEIYANHEQRMSEIGAQADNSLALADKNNAAAMEQLNTRIGAEKDAVNAGYAREDEKVARFNNSILGTDANLFNRPTFDFNTGAGTSQAETEFDSGFEEAVAAKTAAQQPQQPQQQGVFVVEADPNDPNKLKVV